MTQREKPKVEAWTIIAWPMGRPVPRDAKAVGYVRFSVRWPTPITLDFFRT